MNHNPTRPAAQEPEPAPATRRANRCRCGTTVYRGSRADTTPAWNTPNRVATDAANNATPDTTDTTRLRRPATAPTAPSTVNTLAARNNRPATPDRYGSLSKPNRVSTRCAPTNSNAAPATAIRRAGPLSPDGAATNPTPAPLANALPAKITGNSGYASCHDGTAVSANNTPVYVANAGAVTAATHPAACPTGGTTRRPTPDTPRSGNQGTTSATAATPAAGPNTLRIHVPTDIGDVGFTTRNM